MPDHLVFTLVAPMGAFGDLAGHERRGGHGWPGRSAILGLVGAALGVQRDDAEGQAALGSWRTAVAKLIAGTPLRDFHTVQTVPTAKARRPDSRRDALARARGAENTILTRRDHETDCAFAVAIWGGEDLPAVRRALERPHFVPYLGRKSCPLSAPMAPRVVAAETPTDALRQAILPPFWHPADTPDAGRPLSVASDDPIPGARIERRWDDPLDRTAWHFTSRAVHVVTRGEA